MKEIILENFDKFFQAFIHISTAYTNWFEMDVKEEIYPNELDPHDMISFCERFPDNTVNKVGIISFEMIGRDQMFMRKQEKLTDAIF